MIARIVSEHVKFSGRERNHLRGLIRKQPGYRVWCQKKRYRSANLTKAQMVEALLHFGMASELEKVLYIGVA